MAISVKPRPKVRSRRWIRRSVWIALIAGVCALLAWAWMPRPIQAEIAEAKVEAMRVTVDEDGLARVKERHVVSAPLSGNIARLELHAGDVVRRGAVLGRMFPLAAPLLDARSRATAEARVAATAASQRQSRVNVGRAEVALEQAQRDVDRLRPLAASGSIAAVDIERADLLLRSRREESASAELGVRIADHELEVARLALKRMQGGAADEQFDVTSPIDGSVLKVFQQSEGVVPAGAPLVELGNPDLLEIAVDILTSDAVSVRPSARVSLERWGGEPLRGRVRLVEPSAFTKVSALGVSESRVNAVVDLDEPREKWRGLGDGYRVEARIVVWESPDALTIPDGALFRSRDAWAAFVVRDGRARLTQVEVGRKNGRSAQILRGVSKGEQVIVHPSDRIADGARVIARGS